ncbi:hypothetical protein GH714_003528 [Hevea brasiliensis]|uniref:HMA domain-containing protein n=1 Tax=Hevea brasiliensis TaxID=3981 RepID=A0A6A6LY33_HEVBR|nr:hypothetical protein GH714_003528 [Hevea brasiliensis]
MTITEMRVHMDCAGCEAKIKKALQKLNGVDDIDIDMAMQKVTVMGWADQKKYYYQQQQETQPAEVITYYAPQYSTSSYNYRRHGYSNEDYGYYQTPPYSIVDEKASAMFSDENPHACSIM